MNRTPAPPIQLLLGFFALLLSARCASTPPERLYTLSAGLRAERATAGAVARSVVVAPAALPDTVDRPQLVLRNDPDSVVILEQQRWAEPLRAGIARVVADDLAQLLGTWQVSTRDDVIRGADCRVNLDVRRFETPRSGPVISETLWAVACAGSPLRSGRSASIEPTGASGAADFFPSAVAAHGRAIDTLSRDIAAALREVAIDSGH